MKHKILTVLFTFLLFSFLPLNIWADSTSPEPYTYEEFPDTMHKLRRFEIITLGSMPFVSLDISLGYSGYKYLSGKSTTFVNPFSSSQSETYSENEIKGIILSSLGVSVGIGLCDFFINQYKEASAKKKLIKENQNINIIPIENDPEAVKILLPQADMSEQEVE